MSEELGTLATNFESQPKALPKDALVRKAISRHGTLKLFSDPTGTAL
jgi:hypothetical protein